MSSFWPDAPIRPASNPPPGRPLRVLFIGNSYTSVNDLPHLFAGLAAAGGHRVEADGAVVGGWTLAKQAEAAETLRKLKASPWDFVILQEQSQIPSIEMSRNRVMDPAARKLVERIRGAGAVPVFFMTWAHRDGWSEEWAHRLRIHAGRN